ncbi:MAG TPA: serine/threonine-protein kinase [Vicinamibacterales bacterium]
MGEVYRATDSRLGRDVAIKVLPRGFTTDPDRLQRFEREARTIATLNHPNVLAVFDVGVHDGAPFIVSELLEGTTIRDAGRVPVRKAVEYAIQIAHGLAAAHEKGIAHRDLKPDNVFITRDARVKILDFGLARMSALDASSEATHTGTALTQVGTALGTIGYMAPEQVRGQNADHHSDIFAFGATLYEMLSRGRRTAVWRRSRAPSARRFTRRPRTALSRGCRRRRTRHQIARAAGNANGRQARTTSARSRGRRAALAEWSMDRVRVVRVGCGGGLRGALSRPWHAHPRIERRRCRSALEPERSAAVLRESVQGTDDRRRARRRGTADGARRPPIVGVPSDRKQK